MHWKVGGKEALERTWRIQLIEELHDGPHPSGAMSTEFGFKSVRQISYLTLSDGTLDGFLTKCFDRKRLSIATNKLLVTQLVVTSTSGAVN